MTAARGSVRARIAEAARRALADDWRLASVVADAVMAEVVDGLLGELDEARAVVERFAALRPQMTVDHNLIRADLAAVVSRYLGPYDVAVAVDEILDALGVTDPTPRRAYGGDT